MIRLLIAFMLLLAAAAHAAPVMVVDSQPEYWLPLDANGWVDVTPAVDTRIIYVSNDGDDGNNGLTEGAPVETAAEAFSLIRAGYPDQVLFNRGDTWDIGRQNTSNGRSETEPFVVGAYGSGERPILQGCLRGWYDSYVVVKDIHFQPNAEYNYNEVYGSNNTCMWYENCLFDEHWATIAPAEGYEFSNVVFRRNVVYNSWAQFGGHVQGLFLSRTAGALIEENVFDHCGWDDSEAGGAPTMFNHSMYITGSTSSIIVRYNISARASATGAQMRSGGICDNNLFLENPVTLNWGYVNADIITVGGVTGRITNNVVLGDADLCRPRPSCSDEPRGRAITVANVASGTCYGNIVSTATTSATNQTLMRFDPDLSNNTIENIVAAGNNGIHDFTCYDNVFYGWDGDIEFYAPGSGSYGSVSIYDNDFQDGSQTNYIGSDSGAPFGAGYITLTGNRYYAGSLTNAWYTGGGAANFASWVSATGETGSVTQVSYSDPTRSIATYMASLGYAEGDQTVEKFLELARANSKADWDERFTADAVNDYIRAGFVEE